MIIIESFTQRRLDGRLPGPPSGRRLLPTDYGNAWAGALGQQISWDDMAIGASYAVVTFAVLAGIAILRFDRKDILS